MKTEVIMKRKLFGMEIKQRSKTEFFSATDLKNAGNNWRNINNISPFNLTLYLQGKNVEIFVNELEKKYDTKCVIKGRGRNSQTWVHPLLFIDIALAISPKLKIEAYEWLFDHLIRNRNQSGDSYKLMCGNLYVRHGHKVTFPDYIKEVARRIRRKCKVIDWQEATEGQLKKRDEYHLRVAHMAEALNDNDHALRIALKE